MLKERRNNIIWALYYLVLIFIMLSWTNQEVSPNMALRVAFLGAVLFPVFFKPRLCPPAITCFATLSTMGFSCSYLPSNLFFIVAAIFVVYLIVQKKGKKHIPVPTPVIVLLVLVTVVNLFNSFLIENLTYCLLIFILFCCFTDEDSETSSIQRLSIVVTGMALCSVFLLFRDLFTYDYIGKGTGLERTGWTDPNYFGSTIGMAAVCSIFALMFESDKNKIIRIVFIVCVILSFIVMLLVASRGAILSLGVCMILMFFSRKNKVWQKVVMLVLFILLLGYLYSHHYFDLLLYRIEMDETGGSGRIGIWTLKLKAFLNEDNPLHFLFGIGFRNSNYLGYGRDSYACVHNDLINYLIAYGLVGLVVFVLMLIAPLRSAIKNNCNKDMVIIGTVFLFVCGMTLQPLCEGYVAYYCFYFYLWQLSQTEKAIL